MGQDFAALIGSRICHDLISPIGAIGNGLELMALSATEAFSTEEIQLVTQSAENASAKVQFFRIVYGTAVPGQFMTAKAVRDILSAYQAGSRFTYHWENEEDVDRLDLRIGFLGIQCLEAAAPNGGEIIVQKDRSDWTVRLECNGTPRIDRSLWAGLTDANSERQFTSAEVQFALLPQVVSESKRSLAVDLSEPIAIKY
jgi:histidine phosphotransferase ChpT